ncbi:MAG: hypothetical protein AAGN66_30070 [Acidobacteriota bacterium]
MELETWVLEDGALAFALVLGEETLYLTSFHGLGASKRAAAVTQAWFDRCGDEEFPPEYVKKYAMQEVAMPLADITRITVAEDGDHVGIDGRPPGDSYLLKCAGHLEATEIAHAIALKMGIDLEGRTEEISAKDALVPPAISGAITLLLGTALYFSATGESPTSGFRRRAKAEGLASLAEGLGPSGVILLTGLVLVGLGVWAYHRLEDRPLIRIWSP